MVRTARFRSDQNASVPCHNTDEVQCPDRIQFSDSFILLLEFFSLAQLPRVSQCARLGLYMISPTSEVGVF